MKVPPSVQSRVWHGRGVHHSLAALAVLLAVLIVCLRVEAEMAGHDPYCYWDASFPSRSFDVYGQYVNNYYGHWDFPGPCRPTISRTSHLFPAGLAPWAHLTCLFKKLERSLGCTARDVEIQSYLSEREFHCNTLPTTLQRRSAEYADLRPGSADIMIVLVFTNMN